MAQLLPPIPKEPIEPTSHLWREWFNSVRNVVVGAYEGVIAWASLNFTGSNITDILTRNHNDLQNKQGGTTSQYYHLNSPEYTGTGTDVFVRKIAPTILDPTVNLLDLQITPSPAVSSAAGRFSWNATDGTANIGFGFGGVVNQIGQELCFPPLYNNTGGFINEGTVIGITGFSTAGGGLTFVKYIADGTLVNIRAIATTTSDMNNGDRGFATRSGYIRTLDTSGTPYGETWAVSDILYASATVLGGLTNIRPAAPNLIAAIGLVTVVSSTVGVLLMLVSTIQTPVQYGVFSDTTDQAIGAANTPQTITFDTTDVSQGVTVGAPTSRIYIDQAGVYNFQFSLQLTSSVGASRTISIWPRINGADVSNSATEITISSNTDVIVPAWNFVFNMAANDYFELIWASTGNNVQLEAVAVQAAPFVRPAIPSAILTVSQVNQ